MRALNSHGFRRIEAAGHAGSTGLHHQGPQANEIEQNRVGGMNKHAGPMISMGIHSPENISPNHKVTQVRGMQELK
jgi:hypothetical protein